MDWLTDTDAGKIVLGALIAFGGQLIIYIFNITRESLQRKREQSKIALSIVINLTDFINQCYDMLAAPIIMHENYYLRIEYQKPELQLNEGVDYKLLGVEFMCSVLLLPNEIIHIEKELELISEVDDLHKRFYERQHDLYSALAIKIIKIRMELCRKYNIPEDNIYDNSDFYANVFHKKLTI
ncbi:hypothetical protein ACVGA5_003333 [Morganella morganii]|uniref:hypothetical protein n=1 Tax=Morganella morganii TaxID=582 RepID=UPI000D1DA5C8|nr:hypothetical protein [Morganella morganii]QXO41634.1 hypothetical protein CXB74_013420 [Morganella morganii]QXO48845.1 hypothetical protein JC861_13340 [Morganella morganii]QXO52709.1 hypothetical protein JC830_13335 [Morganella morganii]QXO60450.1 hypothetical protein JC826_13180 [Morganella morganii]QXO67978.1 hypothetical protein JC792_13185 [Morganella morganii]